MAASFDIQKIFQTSWGYRPPIFDVALQPDRSEMDKDYFAKGLYGRPYFMPVTLGGVLLPNPVIRISNKKTIVETSMVNRPGTVKELIAQEDYRINIKGIIVLESNRYPEEEILSIQELYLENKALKIESVLTDQILGFNKHVVITDITWPEIIGTQNVKTYEINLLSDAPFDLNQT
jgi:hypothetical protein